MRIRIRIKSRSGSNQDQDQDQIKIRIRMRMMKNLPTASVRTRETSPPRSSVTPHIIAAVFPSSSSADVDDNDDGKVDAISGVADGDGGEGHIGD